MPQKYAIGVDDFKRLRNKRSAYVDKSLLIQEILDNDSDVLLLPRPRRFGKTLNMSMLRYFFEKSDEDRSTLFQDLAIWNQGPETMAHYQRYPVILVSLKDLTGSTWPELYASLKRRIRELFEQHLLLRTSPALDDYDRNLFESIRQLTAEESEYPLALKRLSGWLERHHQQQVWLLIDEYDSPIHEAYDKKYLLSAMDFFRPFFGGALKGNNSIFKAVLTGILRVARENIFSELNHISVFTLLDAPFHQYFGFTDPEVATLLENEGISEMLPAVRRFYNGYHFGGYLGQAMYNPWSILKFLSDTMHLLEPHWVNTSANTLIHDVLQKHAPTAFTSMETLLEGLSIESQLEPGVVFDEITLKPDAMWSLLVYSGYLTAKSQLKPGDHIPLPHLLSIPNQELHQVFRKAFAGRLEIILHRVAGTSKHLIAAMVEGNVPMLQHYLQSFFLNMLSYHDLHFEALEPIHHVFTLGLLSVMAPEYRVKSNRESGHGRPDIMIIPTQPGKPGVVLEFKAVAKEPAPDAEPSQLQEAADQILERDYAAELREAGASPIQQYAVACSVKRVWVRKVA